MLLIHPPADYPKPFGYKCSWLAIRTTEVAGVLRALKLDKTRQTNWQKGIAAAYNGDVFIAPPIHQWILVVSTNLPWPPDRGEEDTCTPWLIQLGKQFSEVQFFATHRVVENHAWARIVDGVLVRQYAFSGEAYNVLWNRGTETDEEVQLRQVQQRWLEELDENEEDNDKEDDDGENDNTNEILMVSESDVIDIIKVY